MLKTIGKVAGSIGVMTMWSLVITRHERFIEGFHNSRKANETIKESVFYDVVEGSNKILKWAAVLVAFIQTEQIWKK